MMDLKIVRGLVGMLSALTLVGAASSKPPRDERFPVPVAASPAEILLAPSAALRSATVGRPGGSPGEPAIVRIVCAVRPSRGFPERCMLLAPTSLPATWPDFRREADAFARTMASPAADPVARAALERVRLIRLRPRPAAGSDILRAVIFTETIQASDFLPPPAAAAERLRQDDLTMVARGDTGLLTSLYPLQALRNHRPARVAMTCRIGGDHFLLCADGTVTMAPDPSSDAERDADMARQFLLASIQAASLTRVAPRTRDGRDTIGRIVEISMGWTVPI
jgi:hypothetical protein